MADLILTTTFELSGGYALAPTLPLAGGVEAAVDLTEVVQLSAVSGPLSRTLAPNAVASLDVETLLGADVAGGVLVVQSTGAVRVECSGVLDARGTTLVLILDANLLTGTLSITNLSATTSASVRFTVGAQR